MKQVNLDIVDIQFNLFYTFQIDTKYRQLNMYWNDAFCISISLDLETSAILLSQVAAVPVAKAQPAQPVAGHPVRSGGSQ